MDDFKTDRERRSEQFQKLIKNKEIFAFVMNEVQASRVGYNELTHTVNRAIARADTKRREMQEEIQSLKDTCERLAIERDEANATIGKMQADFVAVLERVDRIAEWANKQKQREK